MENPESNQKRQPPDSFLKYSGIAVSMVATIAAFGLMGFFIGKSYPQNASIFLLVGLLIGTVLAIYMVIKQLSQAK